MMMMMRWVWMDEDDVVMTGKGWGQETCAILIQILPEPFDRFMDENPPFFTSPSWSDLRFALSSSSSSSLLPLPAFPHHHPQQKASNQMMMMMMMIIDAPSITSSITRNSLWKNFCSLSSHLPPLTYSYENSSGAHHQNPQHSTCFLHVLMQRNKGAPHNCWRHDHMFSTFVFCVILQTTIFMS